MECKHVYFKMVDGVLRCIQCGKTAEEVKNTQEKIEDKVSGRLEDKAFTYPAKSKREKIVRTGR